MDAELFRAGVPPMDLKHTDGWPNTPTKTPKKTKVESSGKENIPLQKESAQKVLFESKTGEKPVAWTKLFDEKSRRAYYYNQDTNESKWEAPDCVDIINETQEFEELEEDEPDSEGTPLTRSLSALPPAGPLKDSLMEKSKEELVKLIKERNSSISEMNEQIRTLKKMVDNSNAVTQRSSSDEKADPMQVDPDYAESKVSASQGEAVKVRRTKEITESEKQELAKWAREGAKNVYGDTKLHIAVRDRDILRVEYLLSVNADLNIKDLWGRDVSEIATGSLKRAEW
mmetsp:Transcript_17354/g.26025  ORF Transcript_17354/g.26025 Transcript_17354/m.26025 type:complete len:285 (-) Transcript_17354:466-1320(-)